MKNFTAFLCFILLSASPVSFQTPDIDKLEIAFKPKFIPGPEKLAITRITVNYKVTSTAKTSDKEKSTGTKAGAKFTAYPETTDRVFL